jgi:hypothetical protein
MYVMPIVHDRDGSVHALLLYSSLHGNGFQRIGMAISLALALLQQAELSKLCLEGYEGNELRHQLVQIF